MHELETMFQQVGQCLRQSDVFGDVKADKDGLQCTAQGETEAYYRVEVDQAPEPQTPDVWIGLYTPDRWLSESIEADLMFKGDKIEELLEEELIEQGLDAKLDVEHFRDDEKRFVFRSPLRPCAGQTLGSPETIERVTAAVLAYEACFRELGDMCPSGE